MRRLERSLAPTKPGADSGPDTDRKLARERRCSGSAHELAKSRRARDQWAVIARSHARQRKSRARVLQLRVSARTRDRKERLSASRSR